MSNEALVSVILTSYRRPQLLRGAIQSVLNQTYPHKELIVVDDDSRMDAINSVRDEFAERLTWITTDVPDMERPTLCRYAVCINQGIAASAGSLLTYLTDDDIYYPTRLERMATWMAAHPEPQHMICYGEQSVVRIEPNGHHHLFAIRRNVGITWRPHGHVDHCSFMHRRSCLERLEKPYWPTSPEAWGGGDMAFYDRLIPHWPFYPIAEILDEKRHHSNSIQSRMNRGESPVYG